MSNPSTESTAGLKERLAALSHEQRALLLRRLHKNHPATASAAGSPGPVLKATPQKILENPAVAVYPASFSQQRMWFLHHYATGSPVYCVPSAFRLDGPLNVAWLERAFQTVIQRHDILRTTFAMENGALYQRVAAVSHFRLTQIDLSGLPADARTAAERHLDEETCRPFDLTASPPFRAVLLRLQPAGHLLLLVLHHIISDGWSRANFYRELSVVYAAQAAGRPPPLPELPVQFADYSAWQRQWVEGGGMEPQIAHWKARLADEPNPLELPSDRPRPDTESFRGGRCAMRLEPDVERALVLRAQEEGATFFIILLAAFKVLLHRYTGRDDLTVGVPVANRRRPELEPLVGCFANTLVLRSTFPAGLTFREWLRRVKETAVEAYEHQDTPFDRLVELLHVRRDASRTPLFQASFAVQDFPAVELILPQIQAAPRLVTTHTSKFDLSLTLERSGDGWTAAAEFNADLFDADRIERMLGHWRAILESVAANPNLRVSEIPLLTPPERQRILKEWNRTETALPRGQCVHQLFEAQAGRTPGAIAVEFGKQHLTYRELDDRSRHLAARLLRLGVGRDVPVALCLERSLEMIVAMLGVLKAGGAYVPLDPKYPRERIQFILRDAAAPVVVTQRSFDFKNGAAQCVYVEDAIPPDGPPPDKSVPPAPAPASLAYLMYTSGSTGQPKGVAIAHGGVVSFLQWMRDSFNDAELSRVLASTSVCFDLSVFEIFGPLSWGGRVLLVNSALDLWSPAAPENVSLINTVPSVLAELLRTRGLPPSIRTVNLAGELLRQPLVEEIFQKTAASRVNDLYGPTETTVYSTWARRKPGGVETVGRPVANTQIYILDPDGQPVPVGIPGELHIGGAGVARGYWRRPELTAARFVPDPFSGHPGGRLFKTGDRARWLADGSVVLLGRADGQVKLRGFRIELGEIEAALHARPGIRHAAVIVREDASGRDASSPDLPAAIAAKDRPGQPRLVAYLVSQDGSQPEPASLRAWLAGKLPEYMVPNAFVWLDQLPMTPNGKLDRKALPAPEWDAHHQPAATDPPATPLELELIRLWREVFDGRAVGRNDNFFDLGGHSLLAMRLTAAIEKLAGRRVPIAMLFQAPTVAALARRLNDDPAPALRGSLVTLQPDGTERPVFCIHGIYGDVYLYVELARELAPDRPVYGLQAVGLDGRQPRHTTVEEMAAHYAREIRSVQPQGPYHLVGASLGGWIAYALAQELTRLGERVALLALLDTRATANVPWPLYARIMAPQLGHRMYVHFKKLLRGPPDGRVHYLKQKLNWFHIYLTRSRARLPVRSATAPPPEAGRHDFVIDYFDAAAARYQPAKYAGDVTLFAGQDAGHFHHAAFWRYFVQGRVRIHLVPGGHGSLITAGNAPKFAQIFKQALREADGAAAVGPSPRA